MTANPSDDPTSAAGATRVVLRPLASPLPLGFLALAVATIAFASVQLSWIPQRARFALTGIAEIDGQLADQVRRIGTEPGVRRQL
ncbi:hypothetical protein MF406_18405 (plasmid) [Georgenia sp. TF02-10]|uniref:hypothetical protein n=1 Tax=Georgenia sp. TF02-10 TaxID=2917725 RepID=UPI001FA7B529|nr:hypothetical protein [Georgenia sp. TF02-10]UNX56619.1 hypothetical protein MF406_18405 [Georgenia sp. TF02-10]